MRDRSRIQCSRDASGEALDSSMKAYGLFDVGEHNTATVQFTHFQLGSLARLDRLYVNSDLFSSLTGFYVELIFFSDHCLVSALFGVR